MKILHFNLLKYQTFISTKIIIIIFLYLENLSIIIYFIVILKLDIMNIHEAINIIKEQASLCEQNREKV